MSEIAINEVSLAHDDSWRHSNIGRLLNNARNRFDQRVLDVLSENGHEEIRFSHFNLIRNLDIGGTIATELAKRAGITKQAMGDIVEQCVQFGIVERVINEQDRREKIVKFNEAGLEWLEAFRLAITTAEQEMRDELGYLRTDAIVSALKAYSENFDQLASTASTGAGE